MKQASARRSSPLTFEQLLLWILGHFIKLTFLHCIVYY